MNTYVSYLHCTPDGTPFYVGKGTFKRAKKLAGRNKEHAQVLAAYGADRVLVGMLECSSEAIAFELEKGLIKCLKRAGTQLTNYTSGGEGGSNPCAETRKRLSAAAKARGISAVCRAANIAARKGKPTPPERRAKLSASNKGKTFTEEHRKNISISAKKRGVSEACRIAASKAGSWGVTRVPKAIYLDGVLYRTATEAAKAIGVTASGVYYALKHSGIVKGHTVREVNP